MYVCSARTLPDNHRLRPAGGDARCGNTHRLVGHRGHRPLQQLDVGLVLACHVRILEENRSLTTVLKHTIRDLRIAAQRTALETLDPLLLTRPAAAPRQLVQPLSGGAGANPLGKLGQQPIGDAA